MPPDLEIRRATRGDTEAVRRLLLRTWHDTYEVLIGAAKVAEVTGRWHAVEVLNEQLVLPAASFLVAERRREIIGHAFARETQLGALFLSRLYVLPSCQRQGVGSRLLKAVTDRHRQTARMVLDVKAANIKGVAFYRRHGFAVLDEKTEDGVTSLRMERALR